MEEYYFLFALGLAWAFYASICDLRRNEAPNWVTLTLLVFALAYRMVYSLFNSDWTFLWFGLLGFGIFFIIGDLLFRIGALGGGDAKLLMGFGAILPIENAFELVIVPSGFLVLLFSVGLIYTLIYSFGLVALNWKKFSKDFFGFVKKYEFAFCFLAFVGLFLFAIMLSLDLDFLGYLILILFLIIPVLYFYLSSVQKTCLVKLISPNNLTEGDWLDKTVHIYGRTIRKGGEGLKIEDLELLKRAKKKVLVRYGIPFIPAHFLALLIMVIFYLIFKINFLGIFMMFFN